MKTKTALLITLAAALPAQAQDATPDTTQDATEVIAQDATEAATQEAVEEATQESVQTAAEPMPIELAGTDWRVKQVAGQETPDNVELQFSFDSQGVASLDYTFEGQGSMTYSFAYTLEDERLTLTEIDAISSEPAPAEFDLRMEDDTLLLLPPRPEPLQTPAPVESTEGDDATDTEDATEEATEADAIEEAVEEAAVESAADPGEAIAPSQTQVDGPTEADVVEAAEAQAEEAAEAVNEDATEEATEEASEATAEEIAEAAAENATEDATDTLPAPEPVDTREPIWVLERIDPAP